MKKAGIIIFIAVIVIAAAWLFLLRPSEYTDESLISTFESKKSSFVTVAEYLTEYNISTTITGLVTLGEYQGVQNYNDRRYAAFNNANEDIMRLNIDSIVSDGKKVEFIFNDEGGLLTRVNAKIAYDPGIEDELSARKLSEKDWYLYIVY